MLSVIVSKEFSTILLIYIYFSFQVGTILPNRGDVYIMTGEILSTILNVAEK